MHLVINATELGRQRGGNESYIQGVVNGLAELNPAIDISLLTCDWGKPLHLPASFKQVSLGSYRRIPFLLWQQTRALQSLKADWYLSNFFLPLILPCNGAVVVHDLSFRAHPDYFPRSVAWYMKWLTGRAIQQAARVFTVSEFSSSELFRFYSADPQKVTAVPNGIGLQFTPVCNAETEKTVLDSYGITKPYIFALGNIHPRKNLGRLLDAYLTLAAQRESTPAMVWGGLQRWASGDLLDRARAANVVLPGFIAQEHLPTLYRQAEMLVYPSLYEGFGLPPAEAMACGTPVITSNTTSLPGVVGDAALTVDPTDTTAIAIAIANLLDDPAMNARLRHAGPERAAQFTWKRTAQLLLNAISNTENTETGQ